LGSALNFSSALLRRALKALHGAVIPVALILHFARHSFPTSIPLSTHAHEIAIGIRL
jgi:hypothetical protein